MVQLKISELLLIPMGWCKLEPSGNCGGFFPNALVPKETSPLSALDPNPFASKGTTARRPPPAVDPNLFVSEKPPTRCTPLAPIR